MNKYLIKSDGHWNVPYISSDILGLSIGGYAPKFSGSCIGIIPNDNDTMFLILNEDDDNYFDNANLTKEQFINLTEIIQQLGEDIDVTIDYVECTSACIYHPDKDTIFQKNYNKNGFELMLTDRLDESAPLFKITHDESGLIMCYDIAWAKGIAKVMENSLKN